MAKKREDRPVQQSSAAGGPPFYCYDLPQDRTASFTVSTYFLILEAFTYFFARVPSTTTRVGACMIPYFFTNSGFSSASMICTASPFSISFARRQLGQVLVVNRYFTPSMGLISTSSRETVTMLLCTFFRQEWSTS